MTFDARGSGGASLDRGNLIFGGLVLLVIGAVFLFAFKLPDVFSSSGKDAPKIAAAGQLQGDALHTAFNDGASLTYFAALHTADPKAYSDLESEVGRKSGASPKVLRQMVMEHSESLVKRNARTLARADVKHVDAMILLMRQGLKDAGRSGSRYCRGSFYAGLANMSESEGRRLAKQVMELEGPMYDWGMRFNTLIAEAVTDAKANPVKHGAVSRRDEAAFQGVMMSLMADPQIMPLIMSDNSGAKPEDLLRKIDVCDLGDSILVAVKTLPQDTKGRAWAMAVKEANSSNPFSSVQGFPGF